MGFVDDYCGGYDNLWMHTDPDTGEVDFEGAMGLHDAMPLGIRRQLEEFGDSGLDDEDEYSDDDDASSDVGDYGTYDAVHKTAAGDQTVVALGEDFVVDHLGCHNWSGVDIVQTTSNLGDAKEVAKRLRSGRCGAAVVADSVLMSGPARAVVGQDLRRFMDQGGTVIIYAWNGYPEFTKVSNRVFGTKWAQGNYFRTVFSRTAAGERQFPAAVKDFSVKCNMIRAPPEEALYTTTAGSLSQSMVFAPSAVDPGQCAVALHSSGGRLAYFGDVNFEDETKALIKALLPSSGFATPSSASSNSSDGAFEAAVAAKTRGNEAFAAGNYDAAIEFYDRSLSFFKTGQANHRLEKAKVLSNRAECELRLERSEAARSSAKEALLLDPDNIKALFRAAKSAADLGDNRAAEADLKRLLEDLDPRNQPAAALLREVRQRQAPPPQHSSHCDRDAPRGENAAGAGLGMGTPVPNGWAAGLQGRRRYELLVDCYRMRLDDDYAWGGCNLHGIYDPDATKETILRDFLVFCKLAVKRGAVPYPWDWAAFLGCASGLLPYAFEKSDAQEKWGSENVFQAMMGGRSLRFTGEQIYGSGIQAMGETHPDHDRVEEEVERSRDLFKRAALFQDVGGPKVWRDLRSKLPRPRNSRA